MKKYVYLIKRKSDGKMFVTYGNFKLAFLGKGYLFEFVSEDCLYKQFTPYGYVLNISTGIQYNSKEYKVVNQVEYIELGKGKGFRNKKCMMLSECY